MTSSNHTQLQQLQEQQQQQNQQQQATHQHQLLLLQTRLSVLAQSSRRCLRVLLLVQGSHVTQLAAPLQQLPPPLVLSQQAALVLAQQQAVVTGCGQQQLLMVQVNRPPRALRSLNSSRAYQLQGRASCHPAPQLLTASLPARSAAPAVVLRRGVWCAQAVGRVAAGARRQSWVPCPSGAVLTEQLPAAAAVLVLAVAVAGWVLQLGLPVLARRAAGRRLLWALAAAAAGRQQQQQSLQQLRLRPPWHQRVSIQGRSRAYLVMTWAVGWDGPAHLANSSSSSSLARGSISRAGLQRLLGNSRQVTGRRLDVVYSDLCGWGGKQAWHYRSCGSILCVRVL